MSFLLLPVLLSAQSLSAQEQVLIIKGQTSLKSRAKGLGLNQGIKSVEWKEESLEGVTIEVKKNDAVIATATSGKKGKYSVQVPVSTSDAKNDFVISFSKAGVGPKLVFANAYVTKEEAGKHPFTKDEVNLDLSLYTTTVPDIVMDKPCAKIKWDYPKEHKFVIDPGFASVSKSEDVKIAMNPDQYYGDLMKKKKKKEDLLAGKNKAAADAKAKADELAKQRAAEEEAKRLADLKAKEDAERIEREKAEALRLEQLKKHMADSLAEASKRKALEAASAKVDVKKSGTETPPPSSPAEVLTDVIDSKNMYDASETYSLNVAMKQNKARIENYNKEKARNLFAKYETSNLLTSLLNTVDENDKKRKQ